MNNFFRHLPAFGLIAGLCLPAASALAQASPAGDMQAPKLQPQGAPEAPLPPAVPGAGDQNLPTSQNVAKQQTGDPTDELFTAINANDYNAAQDAISRGADMNAQNPLGETPIDLSVALNRNSITFMLLAARNDSGDDGTEVATSSAASTEAAVPRSKRHGRIRQAASIAAVKLNGRPGTGKQNNGIANNGIATPGIANPGVPDPGAGFLGFNH